MSVDPWREVNAWLIEHAEIEASAGNELWDIVGRLVAAERDACALVAINTGDGMIDCDDRGMQDPETGEIPCSAERRGEVCVCVERSDLAHKIATTIRARSA